MNGRESKIFRVLTSGALLGVIAILGTVLLAGVHELTRERIAEQERRVILRQLNQVLPAGSYDNDLHADVLLVQDPTWFHHRDPVKVYRARLGEEPIAAVMELVAPDGYNGDIRMMVSVFRDGSISGVRVIAHRETPGLGDPVDVERSDWILGFNDRSLSNPEADGWAVRKDGGAFDQFTGATITPRAVVKAVRRALEYHAANAEALYRPIPVTMPAGEEP